MKKIFYLLLMLWPCVFHAQSPSNCQSQCSGSLGENIFPDGDFGSGVPNIVPINPGIAPGYTYVTVPPPNDGSYVITNNTTSWGSFATNNWIKTEDNGPEPNGYMMVVNAAFAPGLFYEKKVDVCGNTLYEMSVDLISLVQPAVAATNIKSNVAFLIDDVVVCTTGDIAHDAKWHSFGFSFTTDPNVTTVKLAFRNNAPGGFGNDLAIDNIAFRACGPNLLLGDTSWYCTNAPLFLNTEILSSPYTTPVYQWQSSQDGGNTWNNVAGATQSTLAVDGVEKDFKYRLLAANSPTNLSLPNCRSVSYVTQGALEDLSDYAIGGTDTFVCNGVSGYLVAGDYSEFAWSDGTFGSQLAVQTAGWYAVTVTSASGCTGTDSLYVEEIELLASLDTENPVCSGDTNGIATLTSVQGGFGQISTALDGGPFSLLSSYSNLPAGEHKIIVKDSAGCILKLPFELDAPLPLRITLDAVEPIPACSSFLIEYTTNEPNLSFLWNNTANLTCLTCPTPMAMPTEDTWIHVSVENADLCTGNDSVWVDVVPRLELYAPNAFTPDVDDINEFFTIFPSKSAVMVKHLTVYDRWGNVVFQQKNLPPGDEGLKWGGTSKAGKANAAGVYVWFAEIEFTDGVVEPYRGDVLLVR